MSCTVIDSYFLPTLAAIFGWNQLRIGDLLLYTFFMSSRASRIVTALALLICLICPLVEMFDNWDHPIQTGSDTEYAMVVLALCVGVAYSFARFVSKSRLLGFLAKSVFASGMQKFICAARSRFTSRLFDPASSPPLSLRI